PALYPAGPEPMMMTFRTSLPSGTCTVCCPSWISTSRGCKRRPGDAYSAVRAAAKWLAAARRTDMVRRLVPGAHSLAGGHHLEDPVEVLDRAELDDDLPDPTADVDRD